MEGRKKKATQGEERAQVKCQLEKRGWVGEAPGGEEPGGRLERGRGGCWLREPPTASNPGAQISGVAERGGRR